MKTLLVVRHAKSSWEDSSLDDFHRPLNERGEKDAPRMGKRLYEKRLNPDLVLTSPAIRAFNTALAIAEILKIPSAHIKAEQKLYHASEDTLLNFLRKSPDAADCIMLVGHNPGLTGFVNDLLDEDIDNIPTAGVVMAQLDIPSWKDAQWKCGELLFFDYPKLKA